MKHVRARAFGLSVFVVVAVVAGLVGSPSVAYAPPGDPGDPYARVVAEMHIPGVSDDVAERTDLINLVAFHWGTSRTAHGPAANSIVLVKPIDAASTQLLSLHQGGSLLKTVFIYMRRTSPDGGFNRYVGYCFAGAQITAIRFFDEGAVGDQLLEELTISVRKAMEVYFEANTAAGWDYQAGVPWTTRC